MSISQLHIYALFQSNDGLKKVFDEIKTGFSAWFYKHMCNQRNHMHAATYDRVMQFFPMFLSQGRTSTFDAGHEVIGTEL